MPGLLLVDDSATVRAAVKLDLEPLRLAPVREARNGADGLDLARTQHPDLVVVDLLMPVMDGVAFLKALRADPALEHTKVIVLSGSEAYESQLAGLVGPNTFVARKPVPIGALRAVALQALGG